MQIWKRRDSHYYWPSLKLEPALEIAGPSSKIVCRTSSITSVRMMQKKKPRNGTDATPKDQGLGGGGVRKEIKPQQIGHFSVLEF